MNNNFVSKLTAGKFEVWESDMKYIFEIVEKNENRIHEILYEKGVIYGFFHQFEVDKLIKENEKLLNFTESKFKEL